MPVPDEHCDWHVIENTEAARILDDPQEFRFLQPFFDRENTVGQAAQELGVRPVRMYRHVKQLEELGLLCVSRVRPRAGKPIKHYRSVAARFYLPMQVLPAVDLETELLEQDEFWRRQLMRGLASVARLTTHEHGVRIFREQGGIRKQRGPRPDSSTRPADTDLPPTWADWSAVKLSPDDARQLEAEMRDLFARYLHRNAARGRYYLMRTALAPLTDDDVAHLPR